MEMGILFNIFLLYTDLQQLYTIPLFISSSKTHYKLRYMRQIVHKFCHLTSQFTLSVGTIERYCLTIENL